MNASEYVPPGFSGVGSSPDSTFVEGAFGSGSVVRSSKLVSGTPHSLAGAVLFVEIVPFLLHAGRIKDASKRVAVSSFCMKNLSD
jgi:hypothetical protein